MLAKSAYSLHVNLPPLPVRLDLSHLGVVNDVLADEAVQVAGNLEGKSLKKAHLTFINTGCATMNGSVQPFFVK